MAIYSDTDFANDKRLKFKPLIKPAGPASQDLHIGKLFRLTHPKYDIYTEKGYLQHIQYMEELMKNVNSDVPWAKFRKRLEKVQTVKRNGEDVWVISPGQNYLAETMEKITLPKGLGVDVDTRSSWARYGVRVQHVDDELEYLDGYRGAIPLSITSTDVPVILRRGDRTCQAVVYEWDKGMLSNNQILEEMKNGQVTCHTKARFDHSIELPTMNIDKHSVFLTLHPTIRKYGEKLIDPKEDLTQKYHSINIDGGSQIPYNKFFLGSSNEVIGIGNGLVGLLREIFTSPERIRTHSNAGYIDPGFVGTITLEQYLVQGGPNIIYPDMKMGEVEICRMKSPCTKPYKSKYSNQYGATASMGHIDYKEK